MYSLWKRFVKKDASSDVTNRIQHIQQFDVPQHIAIIMDGNGRWAKKGHCRAWRDIMKE